MTDPTGNAWYDLLNAEKNGINSSIRGLWNDTGVGNYAIEKTPVLNDLVDSAEGLNNFSAARRENFDLITPWMTEADQQRFDANEQIQMRGLQQGLSSATSALMSAPGTSLNPNLHVWSWTNYLPKPINEIRKIIKNPWKWGLGKVSGAILDPIYDFPSLAIEHQFRQYGNGQVLGAFSASSEWNTVTNWGHPPSQAK